MTEAERLLRRLGAQEDFHANKKHRILMLDGFRFALHRGGKANPSEIYKVKKQLRKMGRIG